MDTPINQTAIFWPVIVQVVLTLVVYVVMSNRRIAAVRAGVARGRDFKIPNDPEMSASAARNVSNQFELPVLFYVVCLAFYQTGGVDMTALVFAWLFAASRIVHALVHLTANIVQLRRRVFIGGVLAVFVLWVWFAIHIVTMG